MRKLIGFRIDTDVVEALIYKVNAKTQNEAIEFAINYTLANYKNELSESKDLAIRKVIEKIALENYNVLLDKYIQLKEMYTKLLDVTLDLNDSVHDLKKTREG